MKTSELELLLVLFMAATVCDTRTLDSKSQTGNAVGLWPDCPGILKNSSISVGTLPRLQLVYYAPDTNGRLVRKVMTITSAVKLLMKEKSFDLKNKKTILYFGGYLDSSVWPHAQAMATSYHNRGYNVILSETFYFLTYTYPKSVRLSRVIGRKIAEVLDTLTRHGLKAENLELSGISLGAHIAGFTAKSFYQLTGKKVSRLTGLDPAGPCFRNLPEHLRLNSNDAEKVDIIHTNIDGFGMALPIGHVDFYVNGGEFQPGDLTVLPCLVICSHFKAIIYWWQAIEHPKKFIAVKCDSVQDARSADCYNNTVTNYLGLETNFDKPGIYYLGTSQEFPYFMGKEGLKSKNEIFKSMLGGINTDDNMIV